MPERCFKQVRVVTTEFMYASGKDFSPLAAARWMMTAASLVAARQSSGERRLPWIISMRAPSRERRERASTFAGPVEGLVKQRRLRNPRSNKLLLYPGPNKPGRARYQDEIIPPDQERIVFRLDHISSVNLLRYRVPGRNLKISRPAEDLRLPPEIRIPRDPPDASPIRP